MNQMSTWIKHPGVADSLEGILNDELNHSATEVLARAEWSNREIVECNKALANETARTVGLSSPLRDSVKGEDGMALVYRYAGAATDAISLSVTGRLSLTECKYGIKYGGLGPFRSNSAFIRDIAKKFDKMEAVFKRDHEKVRGLRILVVSHDQLPFTISHIKALMQQGLPVGSFSTDGKQHYYVICSTTEARKMMGRLLVASLDPDESLLFKL